MEKNLYNQMISDLFHAYATRSGPGHRVDHTDMGSKGTPKGSELIILDRIFRTGLPHDTVQCRIMYMAYFREEVMFNLKIEATQ